ncbi:unnamed protein product [Alopecurus aequalis]
MGGDSGKGGASEAASLVFRIATMGLSLASAIMTAASTQCVQGGATVSYTDYNSFKYSALADLLSAVLQGVAIYLEVVKKDKAAKAVELIDKLLQALTSTSAALLFAVDDITSCGVGRQRSSGRICTQGGRFCGQIRVSSAFSLAAAASVSISVYARHVPLSVTLTPKDSRPDVEIPRHDESKKSKHTPTAPPPPVVKIRPTTGTKFEGKVELCKQGTVTEPPLPEMPRPCCGCPRRTTPRGCESYDGAVHTAGLADLEVEPEPEPCIQVVHGSVPTGQTTQPHEICSYEPQRLIFYRSF